VSSGLATFFVGTCTVLCAGALFAPTVGRTQELEPLSYANAPVGLNVVVLGYSNADGDVATDPSLPIQDGEIEQQGAVLGYVRTLGVLGRSAKLGLVVPYASLDGSALVNGEVRERSVSGLGDPRVRLAVNVYGSPALSLDEFGGYKQDLVVGMSLQLSAPLGQYDSDKVINIGTNRWSFKPELGISKTWWSGRVTTELTAASTLYTDNRDFIGARREQAPLHAVQSHLVYRFPRGSFAALDATYYTGGRTTVDGRRGDDRQGNSRLGITVSIPVHRNHSLKLHASTGVSVRTGGDFDLLGIGWQVQWGDRL
jgi:hypothetical protein